MPLGRGSAVTRPSSLQFRFNKDEVFAPCVDDVVLDPGLPKTRLTCAHLHGYRSLLRLREELSRCPVNHDVVQGVNMPPGFGAGRETPLGDSDSGVVLDGGGGCLLTGGHVRGDEPRLALGGRPLEIERKEWEHLSQALSRSGVM